MKVTPLKKASQRSGRKGWKGELGTEEDAGGRGGCGFGHIRSEVGYLPIHLQLQAGHSSGHWESSNERGRQTPCLHGAYTLVEEEAEGLAINRKQTNIGISNTRAGGARRRPLREELRETQ